MGPTMLSFAAPPSVGGLELYFSGKLARTISRVSRDEAWWAQLRGFDD